MALLPGSRTAGFIASPPAVSKPCGPPFASVVSTFPVPSGKPKLHETSALMSIPGEELHIVRALDDDEIRAFTAKAMGEQLREIDAAPLVSRGIELLAAGGYHAAILDQGIEFGLDFLDRNAERMELAAASGERRRWWIPKAADQQIAHALLE